MPIDSKLGDAELEAISAAVADAEARTAGEICVHLCRRLRPFERPRDRAVDEFHRLHVDRTRDATGVLLFVTLRERQFEIVADCGIDARVDPGTWEGLAREMEQEIARQGLGAGLVHGVRRIGEILAEHVPRRPDDVDELTNRVSVE